MYKETAEKLGISEEKYAESVEKSLLNKGNYFLIKKVISKLTAGEKVTIAAIGGSVTEGAGPKDDKGNELFQLGYAYRFFEAVKEKYAKVPENVIFDNAALSGSPSALGAVRYEKDVVEVLGTHPDLLFIEFSVNDYLECTTSRGFEYMIRYALSHGTAVIAIYAAATYGNQQANMSPVAQFYNIPEISMSDALAFSGINSEKDSNIFYSDYVHPTAAGHTFMVDCMMKLLEKCNEADGDRPFEIPVGFKNEKAFAEIKTIYSGTNYSVPFVLTSDGNSEFDSGSFCKKDEVVQSIKKGGLEFPDNWHHVEGNEPFEITMYCKAIIFVHKNASAEDFGDAEIYIDEKLTQTIKGHMEGAWNDCAAKLILDEEKSTEHKLTVKMAAGSENKKFTILAIGFAN